ncbi:unnamed protein product [Pleuronectes platessa]|uniref:Uncharacterized protein n=1 Tax=Pleuronectes platessa TaxID=8262 RepID=A0A9N7YN45_PLEPL|nr:unnamed protein product [Pleuronectes platessa]
MHVREGGGSERSARADPNLCNCDCSSAGGRSLPAEVMDCKWIFKQDTKVLIAVPCLAFSLSLPALQFEDTGTKQNCSPHRH